MLASTPPTFSNNRIYYFTKRISTRCAITTIEIETVEKRMRVIMIYWGVINYTRFKRFPLTPFFINSRCMRVYLIPIVIDDAMIFDILVVIENIMRIDIN